MFTKRIEKLADTIIEMGINKPCDKELIIYGLNTGMELILNTITTFVVGLLFGLILESIVFYFSFSFIRTYAGGFHCKKRETCYLASSAMVILVLTIVKLVQVNYILIISILLTSVPVILKFAPIETETKPLDEVEQTYFRKITIRNLAIECLIISIFLTTGLHKFAFVVSLGILVTAFVILLQKIISKGKIKLY